MCHFVCRKTRPSSNWNFIHNYQFVYTINGHDYQLLDDYQYMYPNTMCIDFNVFTSVDVCVYICVYNYTRVY